MRKVKVSTPGKLMLFGEHAVVYNRPCMVAAVDRRFEVEVERIEAEEMLVQASGVGIYDYRKPLKALGETRVTKELRFVEVVVKKFYQNHQNGGVKIETKNHFSSEHGFGSSAAVTVGLSKALHELFKIKITKNELFNFCYQVVLEVQGVGSGFDIAAALYGGVLYFVTGGKKIEQLKAGDLPIVVGYTGVKADTPTLVRQVAELKRHNPVKVKKVFKEMAGIVERVKRWLPAGEWGKIGQLMDENQILLDQLGVSSLELDKLIKAAKKAGAYGAKLSGAGGGDCMIALVERDKRAMVEKAIEEAGGEVMKVKLGTKGARIEK
jgi:mevalonate kinase